MKIAIITTGDEVMAGNVVDTNASWLADHCWKNGFKVVWKFSVGDDEQAIGEACQLAAKKADVVLVSGGLGPTVDDITLQSFAKSFGKQVVQKGKLVPNKVGSADGCQMQAGETTFFFLPGVPKELYTMFLDIVLPWLKEKYSSKIFYAERILKSFGAREVALDAKLRGIALGEVRLSFRVHFPEVWLKLACWGEDLSRVKKELEAAQKKVLQKIGEFIFGMDEETLPQVVGKLLLKKGESVAVAESCTGGFLSNELTNVPGASQYFERGVVAYSNRSKQEILGVKSATIKKFGTVSKECVKEMAQGIQKIGKATYGIGITGIAGPSGGTKEKQVGTVFIGIAAPKKTIAQEYHFDRDRYEFKQLSSAAALNMLRKIL